MAEWLCVLFLFQYKSELRENGKQYISCQHMLVIWLNSLRVYLFDCNAAQHWMVYNGLEWGLMMVEVDDGS